MIITCQLVSTYFVYNFAICIKQFLYSPKFENYSEQRKKNSRLEFSKSLEVPNNDQRLVKTLIWLKFSNGVSSTTTKNKQTNKKDS